MADRMIFVYGSLLSGEPNHHYLQRARFVGEGITHPEFELLDLRAYPAMVCGGKTAVHGEVYAVDDQTLEGIDRLEGHPHYFVRSQITLVDNREVWAYLMRKELVGTRPRIAAGDWRTRSRCGRTQHRV